jgi:hypothetical protein
MLALAFPAPALPHRGSMLPTRLSRIEWSRMVPPHALATRQSTLYNIQLRRWCEVLLVGVRNHNLDGYAHDDLSSGRTYIISRDATSFGLLGAIAQMRTPLCASSSSGRHFAYSFLQTPPCDDALAVRLAVPITRARRTSPPNHRSGTTPTKRPIAGPRAMPGAPKKGAVLRPPPILRPMTGRPKTVSEVPLQAEVNRPEGDAGDRSLRLNR